MDDKITDAEFKEILDEEDNIDLDEETLPPTLGIDVGEEVQAGDKFGQ